LDAAERRSAWTVAGGRKPAFVRPHRYGADDPGRVRKPCFTAGRRSMNTRTIAIIALVIAVIVLILLLM
jgi:hypothetical protein